ncbi:hypothetical protein OG689_44015 [Kitasatospora sp. NBC_00240]|uniref:hypothetical protein n=1 Tax=Kitasatospora sp. NBC_00240 TaxID=2903567 RepID=UPI0022526329|nr:hypothetical protein [Kitasatospora sp. NBC_00240]MCX5216103.1 hypothetical protein [Kitasatospora sp. NBC_00240]
MAGLNTLAAALLGFEAVLAVTGLKVTTGPNWKLAAMSALGFSMITILLSLIDFVVPAKKPTARQERPKWYCRAFPRRTFSISPAGMTPHLANPPGRSEEIIFTTVGVLFRYTSDYVIKPKKHCLTAAVVFLGVALVVGGLGAASYA